jgi:HK97 family phage portal protein
VSLAERISRAASQVGQTLLPERLPAIDRSLPASAETRGVLQDPPDWLFGDGLPAVAAGVSVSTESAIRHANVYSCIRVIVDSAASIPLAVYRRNGADRQRIYTGYAADLLGEPSPCLTQAELLGSLLTHLNGWGNAYLLKIRRGSIPGQVTELSTIHPSRIKGIAVRNGLPYYTVSRSTVDSLEGEYSRRDILHVRSLVSVDGLFGLSPIAQARQEVGSSIAMVEYAGRFFGHGARPGGLLKAPDGKTLTEGAAKRLKADWEAMYASSGKAFKTAILEEGWGFETIDINPDDSQFVEQRKLSATEIARIFRVPPHFIGADSGSSMTYSNVEQEGANLVRWTLRPWLVAIEQAFAADHDIFPRNRSIYPEFLVDALLRADTQARYTAYGAAWRKWMSTNEIRGKENLPAVEGGDDLDLDPTEPAPALPATAGGGQEDPES